MADDRDRRNAAEVARDAGTMPVWGAMHFGIIPPGRRQFLMFPALLCWLLLRFTAVLCHLVNLFGLIHTAYLMSKQLVTFIFMFMVCIFIIFERCLLGI